MINHTFRPDYYQDSGPSVECSGEPQFGEGLKYGAILQAYADAENILEQANELDEGLSDLVSRLFGVCREWDEAEKLPSQGEFDGDVGSLKMVHFQLREVLEACNAKLKRLGDL